MEARIDSLEKKHKNLVDTVSNLISNLRFGYTPNRVTLPEVQIFIESGKDVNWNFGGKTFLHMDIEVEAAKTLIDAKIDINVPYKNGIKPIHCSTDPKVTKLLIDSGADVNSRTDNGNTPLHYAYLNFELVKVLIDSGADVNIVNDRKKSPLHYCQHKDIVIALLKAGANPNVIDENGCTPIFYCKHIDILKILVEGEANIDVKDKSGLTFLQCLCLQNDHSKSIDEMIDYLGKGTFTSYSP